MAALSLLAAAASLAAASSETNQPPGPGAITARHQVCYRLATSGGYPALNIADCLSFDTASDAVFNAQVCGFLRDAEQLRDYDFSSYADCVRRGVTR